jgi:hypothetical protein
VTIAAGRRAPASTSRWFPLASGSNGAPKLRSLEVLLPGGLAFVGARLRKGVKVTGAGRVTEEMRGGQLIVTLSSPARMVTVSISSPALSVSARLSARAAHRRAGALRVMVTVIPVKGAGHLLSFAVKGPA